MDDTLLIPTFVFAYVKRMLRPIARVSKLTSIQIQIRMVERYISRSGGARPKYFVAATTYRPTAFLETPQFEAAILAARAQNTSLLVANLDDLLSGAPSKKFDLCVSRLDELDIDVTDARTGRSWKTFTPDRRHSIASVAAARKYAREMIAVGRHRGRKPDLNIGKNQRIGAKVNQRKAQLDAERIRSVVEELQTGLGPGERLRPAPLMRRLNELSIKGPQSEKWSYNAAKRHLERLAGIDEKRR